MWSTPFRCLFADRQLTPVAAIACPNLNSCASPMCALVAWTDAVRLQARGSCLAPALQAPRGLLPPRRLNGEVVGIDQVCANAPPIPPPCATPTFVLTPGIGIALDRSHSPCLELARKLFFVMFCLFRRRVLGTGQISAPLALPTPCQLSRPHRRRPSQAWVCGRPRALCARLRPSHPFLFARARRLQIV